jgi:nucleotide-binding universal stress UspA family protein
MKSANEMVMDRPELASSASARMAIKSILFAVHDDERLDARLQAALSLARACSAHLQLLHVVPVDSYVVVDTYGGALVSGEIVEVLLDTADKTRIRIEEKLKLEDVSWNYELTTSIIVPELLNHAALADMVIMGREPHFHEFSRTGLSLLGELICNTRTPLCIPGDAKTSFDPFGKAVIAWNGGIESANAVRSAVGLLKMASDVRIVRYTEDKDLSMSDERVLEYLSRHGIHAQIETHLPRRRISEDLVDYALKAGAEYMVMGAYSHSRTGEFLFGGVTRDVLRSCPVSLVMAH